MNRKNALIASAAASAGVAVVAGVLVAVRTKSPLADIGWIDETPVEYLPYRDTYLDEMPYPAVAQ